MSGCASSVPFASAQVNLSNMPAYVRAQAKLTPVPKGPLNAAGTKKFIVALRRSEVNKARAIRIAVANHQFNQQLYAQVPRSPGGFIWPGDRVDYSPINTGKKEYRGLLAEAFE